MCDGTRNIEWDRDQGRDQKYNKTGTWTKTGTRKIMGPVPGPSFGTSFGPGPVLGPGPGPELRIGHRLEIRKKHQNWISNVFCFLIVIIQYPEPDLGEKFNR